MRATRSVWAVVLAGGEGTRLAHLTRAVAGRATPKQYCRLLGDRSLLQATLERAAPLAPPARTIVTLQQRHLQWADQLGAVPRENLVLQSANRDTGPGITAALLRLAALDPAALAVMMPSDHYVDDIRAFNQRIQAATQTVAAHPDSIALLGVKPGWCTPELGYVVPGEPVPGAAGVFRVARFVEKPARAWAERLIERDALWNTFILVFSLPRLLALMEDVAGPEVEACRRARGAQSFRELHPWDFSRHVLARITAHLVVVRIDRAHWSDWGTPEAIDRSLKALGRTAPWEPRRADLGPLRPHATLRASAAGGWPAPRTLSKR